MFNKKRKPIPLQFNDASDEDEEEDADNNLSDSDD